MSHHNITTIVKALFNEMNPLQKSFKTLKTIREIKDGKTFMLMRIDVVKMEVTSNDRSNSYHNYSDIVHRTRKINPKICVV